MEPILELMAAHRTAKLSRPMAVKEYLWWHIAPHQEHSWPMWEYTGAKDTMSLHASGLKPEELEGALATLLGSLAEDPPEDALPQYRYREMVELVDVMPLLDLWGLLPDGHVGPRENPLTMVLDSSGSYSAEDSEGTMEDNADRAPPRPRRLLICDLGMMMLT